MKNNNINTIEEMLENELINDLYDVNYTDDLVDFVKTGVNNIKKTWINIGLEASNYFEKINYKTVEARKEKALELIKLFINDADVSVASTPGELTLIIKTDLNIDQNILENISTLLDQDCIAVYNIEENQGSLIGKLASKWGSFDVDFFKFI